MSGICNFWAALRDSKALALRQSESLFMCFFVRVVEITLKCNTSKYPGEPDGVTEFFQPKDSAYVGTIL